MVENQFTKSTDTIEIDVRSDGWKSIASGLGFYLLGFLGLLASFAISGKVKPVVGLAVLFGAGLVGHGAFKVLFGSRLSMVSWVASGVTALLGLLLAMLGLFLIVGDDFM